MLRVLLRFMPQLRACPLLPPTATSYTRRPFHTREETSSGRRVQKVRASQARHTGYNPAERFLTPTRPTRKDIRKVAWPEARPEMLAAEALTAIPPPQRRTAMTRMLVPAAAPTAALAGRVAIPGIPTSTSADS